MPLIYVMRQGETADAELVRDALQNASRDHFDAVLAAVHRSGALAYARQQAEAVAAKAIAALAVIPDSPVKTAMQELAQLAVNRDA